MAEEITYHKTLRDVDWDALKDTLAHDQFDNGRTPPQLQSSFENSRHVVIARAGRRVIGTARALSDGICNAYIVDVWTHAPFRRRGIGRQMMELLLADLTGQHVYLFTDDVAEFYRKCGFEEQPVGLGRVVGRWLCPE